MRHETIATYYYSRLLALFMIAMLLGMYACSGDSIEPTDTLDIEPVIYPDYRGVTVPPNIAPLNFRISDSVPTGTIIKYGDHSLSILSDNGDIVIPEDNWRQMMSECAGDSICVTVCRQTDGTWTAMQPFGIHISVDTIDPVLVYRLIPPLYGTWMNMGIYQRDLTSYDESPIYTNDANHGNCVNCHSFAARDPKRMLMHMRGQGGATYLQRQVVRNGKPTIDRVRLDTKTADNVSNFTYPYWHPNGRYVAFSVNDIFQIFHNSDPNRTEVIDSSSDVVVYDVADNSTYTSPLLHSPDCLETFPAFSSDGRRLYFCTAPNPVALPENYQDVRYSLCSVDFDPQTGTIGERADTLYYNSGSVSLPRPSPDGRWLVATVGEYGNFHIWHKDADLWICDLNTGDWRPLTRANSNDVDSYHSWSSNSRWLVFSSRRDDGLYTRPYITYIDDKGNPSKPFLLPQKHPYKYYQDQPNSYNIPELVSGHVDMTVPTVVDWISQPLVPVKSKHQHR